MRQSGTHRGTGRTALVLALSGLLLALHGASARAGTLTYREGDGKGVVSQTDDATLDSSLPNTNFGSDPLCQMTQSPDTHCVVKFPNVFGAGTDQVPPGSRILDATLTLFVEDESTDCPVVFQLTEAWVENQATWNSRATAQPWSSGGAAGVASHRADAEGVLPCATPFVSESVDVTRSVQSWSDGAPNEGWVLLDAGVADGVGVSSSETATLAQRPMLTISFVPVIAYSIGTNVGDLKTGLPQIVLSGNTATLDVAQTNDIGVGDEIDYAGQTVYISTVMSPTQFTVQQADGSAPIPGGPFPVSEIRRAFNSIQDAVAQSGDANHLNTTDLASNFLQLHWVVYNDGPLDHFAPAVITGYTTDVDYHILLTVAREDQLVNGADQRHTGVEGTGARVVSQASAQYVLEVDVDHTHVEWLEIDGQGIPLVGGILVRSIGHESFLENLLIHGTRGNSFSGSAINVSVGADDVQVYNLVAYDYGGDGVFMQGSFGKVANSTFFNGINTGSAGIHTGSTGDTEVYNVLAVGPGTSLVEDTPGGLRTHHSITTDTTACDFDVSGFCRANVSPASEFVSLSPVDLHLVPGANAIDFGFDLTGIVLNDMDDEPRFFGLGFDVGADEAPVFTGTTLYRSIGTRNPYGVGLVDVVNGSDVVTGIGAWVVENRGRGDVITIPCIDFPTCSTGTDYTILAVDSDSSLRLTQPYAGPTASGMTYRIDRQFDTLYEWEDCISSGAACTYFPVPDGDLVGGDRSEVGVAYADSVYTLGTDLNILGSTTDPLHTITLTADGVNRHRGTAGIGVVLDAQLGGNQIEIHDDYVTVEWLEIRRFRGSAGVQVEGDGGPTDVLLQNLLIHDFYDDGSGGSGVRLSGNGGKTVTVRNTMIWDGDEFGIEGDDSTDVLVVENCSIDFIRAPGAVGVGAANSRVTVVNTITTRSSFLDYDPGGGFFTGTSTNNISSDGSAPGGNPMTFMSPFTIFVIPGVDLHLMSSANPAIDSGVDLFATRGFQNDVDDQFRPVGLTWDRGADEITPSSLDLAITKDDGLASIPPGTPITYALTVTNNGPVPVTQVVVNDTPPPEVLGPWFFTSNGTYVSGTGDWFFAAPLFTGQSTTLYLNGTIDPAATGSVTNGAAVAAPPGLTDTFPSNNTDTDLTALTPETDLEIMKTGDLDPVDVGGLLTYTLTVTNNGPSDATNVVVTDTLDPALEYQTSGATQGGCGFLDPTVTCNLGPIAAGNTAIITVTVRTLVVGSVLNTASVTGAETDLDATNNSDSVLTGVQTSAEGVLFFTATSTFEKNVLEWLNPPGVNYVSTEVVFRTDRFPNSPGDGTPIYNSGTAGAKDRYEHGGLTNTQTYYYAAFVHRSIAPLVSTGRFVTGRPFDNTGLIPSKWAFSTGAFSITPPTVSGAAIFAPANDGAVYAMQRGLLGSAGEWPGTWEPVQLGGVVQQRSPAIPLTMGGANPVVYLGAQDGNVYPVDGTNGGPGFPFGPTSIATMVQAAPAAIFTNWGGSYSYLIVGTRDDGADNALVALDPDSPGNVIDSFDNGGGATGIGIITGTATVDYATDRVYFTSYESTTGGSNSTLWCLQLNSAPGVFTKIWERALGDINSAPVLHNGRIYVGTAAGGGTVYSINAATGAMVDDRTFLHGNGQVKGFVWPDRFTNDLYFATDDFVWGITDTGAATMPNKFAGGIALGGGGVTPSTVLLVPGTSYLYVGGSDGRLWELDVSIATPGQKSEILGDGFAAVGAPSFDWFHSLVHVGTEAGIFYAVQAPLP